MVTDAVLRLYGSSCNGFGLTSSDLDISMTLRNAQSLTVRCYQIYCRLEFVCDGICL